MIDALSKALNDAERMRAGCRRAVSSSPGAMLTSGVPGALTQLHRPSLGRASEQYKHFRGWAYVAIKAIAQRIAGQDIFVGRVLQQPRQARKSASLIRSLPNCFKALGDRVEPLERHALLDAIDDPNPVMVRSNLLASTVASLKLTGRAHWWLSEFDGRLEIWPLPSHWIEPADNFRSGWLLRPDGFAQARPLPGDDVAAFVLTDPSNPFAALSPLQSQAAAVATDEAIQAAQHRAFLNGIFPGVMIRAGRLPGMAPGQPGERPVLEAEQRAELRDAIKSLYGGVYRYGEPLIVDGMIEGVEKLTVTPNEMAFLDSGKATKARIFQAFGVNPIVVGEIDGANRAQATVAEESFCTNTLNPIVELMSQVLTGWVGARFANPAERLIVWIDPCRAHDPEQSLKEWEAGLRYGAASLNEYRVNVLNLPADDRFDVVMSPATMLERA